MYGPFLTEMDDRAKLEGSRDPLGIQPIWTRLGRYVIGNLTTVTTSARDFSVLLLGYHFAESLSGQGCSPLETFLKWEQLAAYSRGIVNNDWNFRGVQRARAMLEGGQLRIGASSHLQILSNQKTYGLWGLFTIPAKTSGLLEGDPVRLTEPARKLIEEVYLPTLNRSHHKMANEVMKRLASEESKINSDGKDLPLLQAIANMLPKRIRTKERQIMREHLLFGGPLDRTQGSQKVLAQAILEVEDSAWKISPAMIRSMAKNCRMRGDSGEFAADALGKITVAESFLAPAAVLFDYLLDCDGQTVVETSSAIHKHLGHSLKSVTLESIHHLKDDILGATNDQDNVQRWFQIASAMAESRYGDCFPLLLEQNKAVMNARNRSNAWIEIKAGKIQVNYKDDDGSALPKKEEMSELWIHPYFIHSLRQIAVQLREEIQ